MPEGGGLEQGQDTYLEPRAEESHVFLKVRGEDRVADEDNGTEEPTVQKRKEDGRKRKLLLFVPFRWVEARPDVAISKPGKT